MKKLWWILLVFVVLAAGAYFWIWPRYMAKAQPEKLVLTTIKVQKGTILQSVASTGRIVSNLDVDIKCKASGEIIALPFDVSQRVKKDDLIVELDPVDEVRSVKQAEVAVAQSQAKLAQARENLRIAQQNLQTSRIKADANFISVQSRANDLRSKASRRKELFEKKLSSEEEYTAANALAVQAESDIRTAQMQIEDLKSQEITLELRRQDILLSEAQLASDQLALETARQRLADTKVVAPMDGVVAALNVQKGQIISSGITNVGGGTTTMTLSDLSRMFVLASVDESDIGKVQLGQSVTITVDAHAGKKFYGTVARIATRGVNVSNVVTFEVKIEVLDKKMSLLKPEMTANVQIIVAERENVLVVPAAAVSRNKAGNRVVTLVVGEQTSQEVPVEVGLTDGEQWEITKGLEEGQSVSYRKDETMSKWRGDTARSTPAAGMMIHR